MTALLSLLLSSTSASASPPTALTGEVTVVQAASPRIACAPPWCEARIDIQAPPEVVEAVLLDFAAYPEVFPRVRAAEASGDLVHVTLAMPFPLSDRDYVVSMRAPSPGVFVAEPAPDAVPETEGVVRLPDFAGRWELSPLADGAQTRARYIWHTDLGADIPTWAVERAWRTQGQEILGRLKVAAEEG